MEVASDKPLSTARLHLPADWGMIVVGAGFAGSPIEVFMKGPHKVLELLYASS